MNEIHPSTLYRTIYGLGETCLLIRSKIAQADKAKLMLFSSRNSSMDAAMKAGIGAAMCSVLILALVFLAMTLPVSIG